jgi:hypothetical protein
VVLSWLPIYAVIYWGQRVACTWPSWRNWRALRGVEQGAAGEQRALFLAQVGTMVGLLSALVIAAQWLPQWIVRTCSV